MDALKPWTERQAADRGVETPCVQVCVVDEVTGFCIGCGRSRREIVSWSDLSSHDRAAISELLPLRLRSMTSRAVRGRRRKRTAPHAPSGARSRG